jgi:hypothetical protein
MTPKEHATNLVDKIKYAYFNEELMKKHHYILLSKPLG